MLPTDHPLASAHPSEEQRARKQAGALAGFSGSSGRTLLDALPESAVPADQALPDVWRPEASPRPWRYIVFHHTATEHGDVEQIDAAHRQRTDAQGQPWQGIGYHFVIGNGQDMADGLVEPTFRWREQLAGAHAGDSEHNEQGIGICLIGNFDQRPPTERQVAAARHLVKSMSVCFDIPRERILGHGELKSTACPGKNFSLAAVTGGLSDGSAPTNGVPLLELPARVPAAALR